MEVLRLDDLDSSAQRHPRRRSQRDSQGSRDLNQRVLRDRETGSVIVRRLPPYRPRG